MACSVTLNDGGLNTSTSVVEYDSWKKRAPNLCGEQRVEKSLGDDGGMTWQGRHVAGSFNMVSAPESNSAGVSGLFVGDYQVWQWKLLRRRVGAVQPRGVARIIVDVLCHLASS